MKKSRALNRPLAFAVIIVTALLFATLSVSGQVGLKEFTYTEWIAAVEDDQVREAEVLERSHVIEGTFLPAEADDEVTLDEDGFGRYTVTYSPEINAEQIADIVETATFDGDQIAYSVNPENSSALVTILINFLPLIFIFVLFFFLMSQMQGGGRIMQFGRSKAKMISKDASKVTFADVAGAEEAVEELREIKDFLSNPQKFQEMGARIPKGVLLFGPPGTGKTLLARAVAGEAGVPFFTISGSDFVEMFVGVGASRVRDLFEQAKNSAPAIIFMDEIDAVGRHRGAGLGGGHDEREQTLNQLLVEMDGFDQRTAVILIAATNRPDILDPALLRPGRFDRQIVVDRPDLTGREAILRVHAEGKPISEDIDLKTLARQTPGFTGADLSNLVNEAALLAARFGKSEITMSELEEAIERVVAGPERKTRLMNEKEKRIVAYHEAGHAIVGHALPQADPVHKISIIPRGRALGFTMQLPTEDKYLSTRGELIDRLAVMLGGRVAEELKVGDITTGAGDDIKRATATAREMVTQYGMSEELGPITLGQKESQPFLGRDLGHQSDYSGHVAAKIDAEVAALVDEAHDEALEILVENNDVLEAVAEQLLEVETLDGKPLEKAFEKIRERPSRAGIIPKSKSKAAVIKALRRGPASAASKPRSTRTTKKTTKKPSGKTSSSKK